MSIPIWCEIVCAECAHTLDGQFTRSALPRRSLMKGMREAGWIVCAGDVYCSHKCAARSAERERDAETAQRRIDRAQETPRD